MKPLRYILLSLLMLTAVTPRASAQYYGVGCNVALLSTGTLNLSVEAAIAPRWSIDIPVYWNPVHTDKLRMQLLAIQPGVRYWFFEEYAGHFLGFHLAAAKYDIGNVAFHRKGWCTGFGISYGHSWLLSPRWNCTVEAGIGIYYMQDQKRDYDIPDFNDEYIRHNRRLALGPSKCSLSFTYLF